MPAAVTCFSGRYGVKFNPLGTRAYIANFLGNAEVTRYLFNSCSRIILLAYSPMDTLKTGQNQRFGVFGRL